MPSNPNSESQSALSTCLNGMQDIRTEQRATTLNVLHGRNGHRIPVTRIDIVRYVVDDNGNKTILD